jgi:hypothetical protein
MRGRIFGCKALDIMIRRIFNNLPSRAEPSRNRPARHRMFCAMKAAPQSTVAWMESGNPILSSRRTAKVADDPLFSHPPLFVRW